MVRGEWAAGNWDMSDVSTLQLPSAVWRVKPPFPFTTGFLLDNLHDTVWCSSTLYDFITMVDQVGSLLGVDISLGLLDITS